MPQAPSPLWRAAPVGPLAPAPDGADLWLIPLRGAAADDAALSEGEKMRAARFVFDADRAAYIAAHAALRAILSRYVAEPPAALRFVEGAHGKPALIDGGACAFNLSHAGDYALLGVTHGRAIGVDIEPVRAIPDRDDVAASHFSVAEREALNALPEAARDGAFYAIWTRKEAFIKLDGAGLSLPLSGFTVSLGDEARLLHLDHGEARRYTLKAFHPIENYRAALCVEGPCAAPRFFTFDARAP